MINQICKFCNEQLQYLHSTFRKTYTYKCSNHPECIVQYRFDDNILYNISFIRHLEFEVAYFPDNDDVLYLLDHRFSNHSHLNYFQPINIKNLTPQNVKNKLQTYLTFK